MTRLLKDRPWTLGVLVIAIAGPAFGIWSLLATEAHEWNGAAYQPPRDLGAVTLTDTEGDPLALDDLRGRPVLLYFGYTHCPDFCPMTLTEFLDVKERLGDRRDDVAFMMISVDPERDTPERMKQYLTFFDPAFIGLTGTADEVTVAKQEFGITTLPQEATPGPSGGYLVDHSTQAYLLDLDGDLLLQYPFGMGADAMEEDVRHLLDTSPAPADDDGDQGGDASSLAVSPTSGPDTGTGVVYLTVTNDGDADDALVSARTDRSERVELHESEVTDGIARMTPMGGDLPIPAGESVTFDPGGRHLMLVNLTADIRPGDSFDLVLEFAGAGEATIPVTASFNEEDVEGEAVTVGDLTIEGGWSRPAPRLDPAGGTPAGTPTEEHDGH